MMWYFRETFHELLVRQSGQIHLLIIAPILTLFFFSLIVRSADSAIGSAAEKEKVAAQLRKRLEEVREGETLLAKESLPPAPPLPQKEKIAAQPEERLEEVREGETLLAKESLPPAPPLPQKEKIAAQPEEQPQEGAESKPLAAKEPSGLSSPHPAEEKHKIRKRETFASILRSRDFDAKEVERWIQAAKGVRELKKLRPGHPLILRFDRKRSRLQEIAYEINSRTALIIRDKGESIEVSQEALPVTLEWKGTTGRIKSNLYNAAVKAGVPDKIISEVVDIFSWDIDFFSDLRPGDTFKVIYEEFMRDGRVVQVGRVLAAEIFNKGKALTAFYVNDQDGHQGYYNSQGRSIGGHFLKYPLEFTRISSVFQYSRFHPILKVKRPHLGVDFAAPTGTPVRAVASGKVVRAGYRRDFGNHVKIVHNGLYASSYSHLKRISKGIKVGTQIKVGQVIGQVGSTGLATGPHLHYALYKGKRYINPLSFDNKLLAGKTEAPKRVSGSFAKIKKQLVDYLAALKADNSPLTVSLAVPEGFVTLSN